MPLVSGKHPQDVLGESNGTGENVPLGWEKGCSNVGGPLGETKGTGKLGHGNLGLPGPRASSTSPRRLPVLRSTNVIRLPPSSVRWLSALPMINISGSSTSPTEPK